MWVDDPGGHYQVSLNCRDDAVAVSNDVNDPRGISVDPRTGVVTATPQREGVYRDIALVATTATDGGDKEVVVVKWSFNVTARSSANTAVRDVKLEATIGAFGGLILLVAAVVTVRLLRARAIKRAPYDFNEVLDSMDDEMVMIASTGNKVYPIELRRSNIKLMDQIGRKIETKQE